MSESLPAIGSHTGVPGSMRWMLPIGIVSSGFVLISLDPIREAIRGFGVAAVSPSDFEYAGEAASIAGWLLLAIAANLSTGRLSPIRAPTTGSLLRGAAIASVGLTIAAALNLAESAVIFQQHPHLFSINQSIVSLVRSLYRSADGVGLAAWLAATVGAAISLIRVRHESETPGARFTVALLVVLTAAAAQTIASAIRVMSDWTPSQASIGWLDAILGLQAAGWFFFSVALFRVVASAHREHGWRWLVALTVGALGPLLLASNTMLAIVFYEQWVGVSGYAVLGHWQDCLLAAGWIVLAIGGVLFARAIGSAPRAAGVRSEHETRWWIREVLANRS